MYPRSVASAARIGASLEPFEGHAIHLWRDADDVLHFDQECPRQDAGVATSFPLAELHRFRHCATCTRPYRLPDRVEHYADAVEALQRAKFLATEAADGPITLGVARSSCHADAARRRAVQAAAKAGDAAGAEIERLARRIGDQLRDVRSAPVCDQYLDWAASLSIDPTCVLPVLLDTQPGQWLGIVEHARSAMRDGGWAAFDAATGDVIGGAAYRHLVAAERSSDDLVLYRLGEGEGEGDLLVWLAAEHAVLRHGIMHAAVGGWVLEVAELLGVSGQAVGPIGIHETDVVEIYADLHKTRTNSDSLHAARLLHRARRRS